MNKEKLIKILIPVMILAVVAGIWFVKNKPDKKQEEAKTNPKTEATKNTSSTEATKEDGKEASSETKKESSEPDFSFTFTEALNFDEMKKHGLPIIADYGSAQCGPCVAMHPALEAIHKAYEGKAFIKYADVWESQAATSNVPVRVTPTQVLFNADGKPFVPSEEILNKFGPTSFTSYQNKETNEHVLTVHEGMLSEEEMKLLLAEMGVKE